MSVYLDTECTTERLILDLRALGFEELPAIGRYRYCASHSPLQPDSHEGLIEVHLLEKGEQIFYLGEESYILRGKNLFLALPGEVHSTGENPLSNGKLYWFFMKPPGGRPYLGFDAEEASGIGRVLLDPRERLFADGSKLIRIIERIFSAAQDSASIFSRAMLKSLLMELVLALAHLVDPASSRAHGILSPRISAVLEHIGEYKGERIRVENMASVAGLSVPRFKEEVGFTPNAYLNHVRINAAKKALASGTEGITSIALDLGYPSSQYFSHVFRKFMGRTPSQYREDPTGQQNKEGLS